MRSERLFLGLMLLPAALAGCSGQVSVRGAGEDSGTLEDAQPPEGPDASTSQLDATSDGPADAPFDAPLDAPAPNGSGGLCPPGSPPSGTCAAIGESCLAVGDASACSGSCVCGVDGEWHCLVECSEAGPPPNPSGTTCCEDGQNLAYPPAQTDISSLGFPFAWQYVPGCDIDATEISLWNAEGSTVAILDSVNGQPGFSLWSGSLPISDPLDPTWEEADIRPPLQLSGGHVYFIEVAATAISIASGGVEYPYYSSGGDGSGNGWEGPNTGYAFTSRITGNCQ